MSEAAVSNLENDLTDITLSQLEDIAIVLDIEVEHLFSDPQEMVEKKYSADEQEKNEYVQAVNSFQGVDNSHKVIVVECPTPNSKPELIKIEKQDNDKVYELTETTVVENIIRNYGQPKALHSISVSGSLGLTREIEEGKIVYDERTADEREKLGIVFKQILTNWFKGNPSPTEDYTIVPITGLTEEKKTKSISENIEVGKLTALQMTITDQNLTPQQKINFLVVVYGIDYTLASAMVNGTTLPTQILQ
jgi:transcriptional regulator with XRE-family HTH domain